MISQEAINFLTKCVWAKSPDIFAPSKLKSKTTLTCLGFEHVAMPMVHPTTGETISSYKKLMHYPATSEMWQTAFGKDFRGMAQGDNKMGQKGTNSIFVVTHDKISRIPKNKRQHMPKWWSISNHKKQIRIEYKLQPPATSSIILASS
jgi:hypothetical protein